MKHKPKDGVYELPSGRWSIPCGSCGKRHVQRYSDDFVWCQKCRAECAESGHEPNDEDPTWCFTCGQSDLPAPPPEEFKDCATCHGEGQVKVTGGSVKSKKKAAGKKKQKTKDIELDFHEKIIPGVKASEFAFPGDYSCGVSIMVIEIPKVGVFVTGKGGDAGTRLCWAYPVGTVTKKAVSLSIAKILEEAAAQLRP